MRHGRFVLSMEEFTQGAHREPEKKRLRMKDRLEVAQGVIQHHVVGECVLDP